MTAFDRRMVQAAKDRRVVRLRSGSVATLVSWGVKRRGRWERERAMCETCDGSARFTVPKVDIVALVDAFGDDVAPPATV